MLKLDGPHFHFRLRESGLPLVLIFSAKDLEPYRFNFWQLGCELPANVLFMNNGANDWYQFGIPGMGTTVERTVEAIRKLAETYDCPEILALGTSMGGYAAIHYGIELGARVLAFSTSTYLTQPLSQASRLMKRPDKAVVPDLRAIMPNAKRGITLVCGESQAVDLVSCLQLSSFPNVRAVGLAGIGHYAPMQLTRAGKLGSLLSAFIAGKDELVAPQDIGQALQYPEYVELFYAAAIAYHGGKVDEALDLCRKAAPLYPAGDGLLALLACCLNDKGSYAEARHFAALAMALSPDNQDHPLQFGRSLVGLRETQAALRHYQRTLSRWPQQPQANYELGVLLQEQGNAKAGTARIKTAEKLGFNPARRHAYHPT